jgi:hypothetical protein
MSIAALLAIVTWSAAPAPVQDHAPRGRCTWNESHAWEVFRALQNPDDRTSAHSADCDLRDHARLHGWGSGNDGWTGLGEPDFLPAERAGRCPAHVLDQLLPLARQAASPDTARAARSIAAVFNRNGRVDEALAILSAVIDAPTHVTDGRRRLFEIYANLARRAASDFAFRDRRWDVARRHASAYERSDICGYVAIRHESWRDERIARCALALGDWPGLQSFCRERFARSPAYGDSALVETWIVAALAQDPCATADGVAADLARRLHSEWHPEIDRALRQREFDALDSTELLARLPEVAAFDADRAFALLVAGPPQTVDRWLWAFEIVDDRLRNLTLAGVLACTGNPRIRASTEPMAELGVSGCLVITWERANERWNELTGQ